MRLPRQNVAYVRLLQVLYDIVYLMVLLTLSPVLLYKFATSPKYRAGLWQRLGALPEWPWDAPRVWIHGVSVGEVLAAKSLVTELEREFPRHEIVLSTTTKTGQEVARKHYPGKRVFYYPLDFSFSTRRVLARVNPQAVILMELEIWPNFLLSTSATAVPVLLVNGRISRRSFGQYRVLQRVLPEPMDRILLYCVQTKTYGERFLKLGVRPDRVHVTGTMKFDNINTADGEELRLQVVADLRLEPGDRVLMGGSTHPGEEEVLYGIFTELAHEFPSFRLVVVPRHPERLSEVESRLRKRGAPVVRKTHLGAMRSVEGRPVVLVDTMGELARMYAVAELVFVGGSLIPHGGQNMIEPAGLGRAVLFGPHTHNFQESVDILLDARAAVRVRDADELRAAVLHLARNPGLSAEMGDRARRAVIEQKGASRRIMELIRPFLTGAAGRSEGRETRET